MRRILLLTGMTPDQRIFDRLRPLLPSAVIVEWIQPTPHESIQSYAVRLSNTLDRNVPTVVCGVSFGGIVAVELASCMNADSCVLISSISSPSELPPWFRLCRLVPPRPAELIMRTAGTIATYWPRRLKSSTTWRLMKLAGETGDWHRWASAAVLNWKPSKNTKRTPLTRIHGDRDATFPSRYLKADMVIKGGGHVLPLTHFKEIAQRLNEVASL